MRGKENRAKVKREATEVWKKRDKGKRKKTFGRGRQREKEDI